MHQVMQFACKGLPEQIGAGLIFGMEDIWREGASRRGVADFYFALPPAGVGGAVFSLLPAKCPSPPAKSPKLEPPFS